MLTVAIENGRIKGYLTTAEFAKKCKVEQATVRVWIKRGKINCLKIGKENWIHENTIYPGRSKNKEADCSNKRNVLISKNAILEEYRNICGPMTGDGWDDFGVRNLILRQPEVKAIPIDWLEEFNKIYDGMLPISEAIRIWLKKEV